MAGSDNVRKAAAKGGRNPAEDVADSRSEMDDIRAQLAELREVVGKIERAFEAEAEDGPREDAVAKAEAAEVEEGDETQIPAGVRPLVSNLTAIAETIQKHLVKSEKRKKKRKCKGGSQRCTTHTCDHCHCCHKHCRCHHWHNWRNCWYRCD